MVEVEQRLVEIREQLTNEGYSLDDIYNCDETGFYIKEQRDSTLTTRQYMSGSKPDRGANRVTVLFIVNATGSSHAKELDPAFAALRPLVIAKHFPKDFERENALINCEKSTTGWMNKDIFRKWLTNLDDCLTRKSALILDSYSAHNDVEFRDPVTETKWRHLTIIRLPGNSTSVSQPLDAGIIAVFKRWFLNMLSDATTSMQYARDGKISNGEAWALIPYVWSQVKSATIRNCWIQTKVLPEKMVEALGIPPSDFQEREAAWPVLDPEVAKKQELLYLRLLATVTQDQGETRFSFQQDTTRDEQEDALAVEEAIRRRLAWKESTRTSAEQSRQRKRQRSPVTPPLREGAVQDISKYSPTSLQTWFTNMLDDPHSPVKRAAKRCLHYAITQNKPSSQEK